MLSLWIQFVLSSSLLSDSWTGPLSSNATSAIVKAGIGSSSSNKAVSATENTTELYQYGQSETESLCSLYDNSFDPIFPICSLIKGYTTPWLMKKRHLIS